MRPPDILPEWLLNELARREQGQQHLSEYAEQVVGVVPAAHHKLICDVLEQGLLNDEWDDCVICSPPGSAKSSYVSHVLPAWFLGHFPEKNVILASHTASLAEKWSRRVRDTIASPEHARVFENSTLSRDSTAVTRWTTSRNGEFLAAGVGMSILGFRADCVIGDSLLTTRTGIVKISDVEVNQEILSYDPIAKTPCYRRVLAKQRRNADVTYRIHTTDGDVVEATGNHPIFVSGGFKAAASVAIGDILLSAVREDSDPSRCGGSGSGGTPLLFRKLLQQALQFGQRGHQNLHRLPEVVHAFGAACSVLFEKLRWNAAPKNAGYPLWALWNGVPASQSHLSVLFDHMQERRTRNRNESAWQSSVPWWNSEEPLRKTDRSDNSSSATNGDRTGRESMCDLSLHDGSPVTSHRLGCDQQLDEELGHSVQGLSRNPARRRARKAVKTSVARIEIIRKQQGVWDIQVEDTHTFFTGSRGQLLIHNCAILDDPVSGWEQAQSVTQLQKIHEWFKSDLKSRLKPRAKIITVCQRTAAYDMAGYIMKEFADNPTRRLRTVILPMVCEDPENDPMGRALGERLWPEWYTDEMVADLRKDEFTWKTMWMQQPPSDSGSWVTTEEIQYRPSPPVTKDSSIYGMTDLALSVNTGDYTTHFLVAVDAEGAWDIIHGERERCDPDTSANKVVSLCSAYQPREWLIDDDNMAKVFMPLLATRARSTSTNVPIKMMPMRGQDKETRAAPLRGQFKRRRIYMDPKAPFVPWLVKELLSFPNAVGEGVDDGVDALGLMGRRLMAVSKATNVVEFKRNPTTAEMTLDQLWEDQPNPATARF